jgi:hypothetical protein
MEIGRRMGLLLQQREELHTHIRTSTLSMLLGVCLNVLFEEYEFLEAKMTLFDELCVPAILGCSTDILVKTLSADSAAILSSTMASAMSLPQFHSEDFSSVNATVQGGGSVAPTTVSFVKYLFEITQRDTTSASKVASDPDAFNSLLFAQSCAYTILQHVYDRCSLDAIKGEIHLACIGPTTTGKELTQFLCKNAHTKVLRTPFPSTVSAAIRPNVAQRLFSAAYNFLLMAVAKTQTDEKLFDNLLFKEKPGEGVWQRIVDCGEKYLFLTNGGRFDVVLLAGGDVTAAGGGSGGGGAQNNRLRRGRGGGGGSGAGGYLSQYMAGSVLQHSSYAVSQSQALLWTGSASSSRNSSATRFGRSRAGGTGSQGITQTQSQGGLFGFSQRNQSQSQSQAQDGIDDMLWTGSSNNRGIQKKNGSAGEGGPRNSKYDLSFLTRHAGATQAGAGAGAEAVAARQQARGSSAVSGLDDTVIALELNEVNRQPCMAALVRVIQRMHRLFHQRGGVQGGAQGGVQGGAGQWEQDVLPGWLSTVRDRLADYSGAILDSSAGGTRNVRLFMLRLLCNQPVAAIAARWAAQLLPAGELLDTDNY